MASEPGVDRIALSAPQRIELISPLIVPFLMLLRLTCLALYDIP